MFDRRHFVYQFDKMFQHLPWKYDASWPNSSPFSSPSVRIFAESGSTLNEKHLLFCSQFLMFSLQFFFKASLTRHGTVTATPVKSLTWTLKGFLCVSVTSRCEISSDPRKLHLNRDKPWPSLRDRGGLGRLENISGWIVNLHVAFGARPVRIFSGIHIHTTSAWIARQRGRTIVHGDQRWDKDKLSLNDFWHQLLSQVFNPTGSLQMYQKQILWLCYCPTFNQLPSGS